MDKQPPIVSRRSPMRKGYLLIEVLTVVIVAPLLMVLVSAFFRSFLRDIPQTACLLDQSVAVLDLLDQLRKDADLAIALPSRLGDRHCDEATLLIEQPGGCVCYRFDQGRIVRSLLDKQGNPSPDGEHTWQARDAVVRWRPWGPQEKPCAIEVHSHLKQWIGQEWRRRFVNSHVFFIGGLVSGGTSHE
ncbi:MAG TPA: hypothetical protein VLI39_02570 [Sedimentisphaerales bacterium]|nr:hypothetical protein [Sedimentisphaerales bacterium]